MKPTPDQWRAVQRQIRELANTKYPMEACGFIFVDGDELQATSVVNIATWPYSYFQIKEADTAAAFRTGRCIGVWHSHPEDPAMPSERDTELAHSDIYFVIYAVADEDMAVFVLEDDRLVPEVMVMPS